MRNKTWDKRKEIKAEIRVLDCVVTIFKSTEDIFDIYCQSNDIVGYLNLQDKLEPPTLTEESRFLVYANAGQLQLFFLHDPVCGNIL